MIIKTEKFGETEISEDLIFNFIEPLLCYESLKKFALIDHMPDSPFKWLQSLEDENIALPITIPAFFGIDYQFVLPEEEAKRLAATNAENLLILNIVCIPNGRPQDATVNLLGPVVINMENKNALQLVLLNTDYQVKHRLFPKTAQNEQNREKVHSEG